MDGMTYTRKINAKNLGFAGGILWGAALFLITLISMQTEYADQFLGLIAGIYPGFTISFGGSLVGAVYGFIDGFVGLYILAWLYNKFQV